MIKNKPNVKRISSLLCKLFIVAMMISLINPLQVHAESLVQAIVDSISADGKAGNQTVPNGIKQTRTGYMVYLLDIETGGEVYGKNGKAAAYALRSSDSGDWISGFWKCTSRKGNYSVSGWNDNFPKDSWWNMLPWNADGDTVTSKESDIKAWMLTDNGAGTENVVAFVANLWQDDLITEQFKTNQIVLVVETIMNFRYSISESGLTSSEAARLAREKINELVLMDINKKMIYLGKYDLPSDVKREYTSATDLLKEANLKYKKGEYTEDQYDNVIDKVDNGLNRALRGLIAVIKKELQNNKDLGGHYEQVGDPVYGTVNTLVKYKKELGIETSALDSYVNRRACFAEYIEKGGIGEQVGFTAWNGAPSNSNISNSDVMTYGLGMMVIQANSGSASTHTWDHQLDKVIPITTNISNSAIMTYGLGMIIIFD